MDGPDDYGQEHARGVQAAQHQRSSDNPFARFEAPSRPTYAANRVNLKATEHGIMGHQPRNNDITAERVAERILQANPAAAYYRMT